MRPTAAHSPCVVTGIRLWRLASSLRKRWFEQPECVVVVSDIDVRLLRVFRAVVEAGGFANAQAILNVGASTISTQMSQLGSRLGCVVCHRGRGGFKLTDKGEALYRLVVDFFQSVHNFETQAAELRGGM